MTRWVRNRYLGWAPCWRKAAFCSCPSPGVGDWGSSLGKTRGVPLALPCVLDTSQVQWPLGTGLAEGSQVWGEALWGQSQHRQCLEPPWEGSPIAAPRAGACLLLPERVPGPGSSQAAWVWGLLVEVVLVELL